LKLIRHLGPPLPPRIIKSIRKTFIYTLSIETVGDAS
jgi:hypothetical protein